VPVAPARSLPCQGSATESAARIVGDNVAALPHPDLEQTRTLSGVWLLHNRHLCTFGRINGSRMSRYEWQALRPVLQTARGLRVDGHLPSRVQESMRKCGLRVNAWPPVGGIKPSQWQPHEGQWYARQCCPTNLHALQEGARGQDPGTWVVIRPTATDQSLLICGDAIFDP
jgi:hypothetical protein